MEELDKIVNKFFQDYEEFKEKYNNELEYYKKLYFETNDWLKDGRRPYTKNRLEV